MIAAYAPMSSGQVALRLLQAESATAAPARAAARPQDDMAADSLEYQQKLDHSFRLGQANMLKGVLETFHMSYATAAKLALAVEAQTEAMVRAVPQPRASFGAADAARIASLGADAAIRIEPPVLDRAAFDDLIRNMVLPQYKGLPGFDEAMAQGKVVVQRASEVPEFNYGHVSYALFQDGYMIGGGGWGKPFNQGLYDAVARTGVEQAFGGVMGQDYHITWPSPGRAAA